MDGLQNDFGEVCGTYECGNCYSVLLVHRVDVVDVVDHGSVDPEASSNESVVYAKGFVCPSPTCAVSNVLHSAVRLA